MSEEPDPYQTPADQPPIPADEPWQEVPVAPEQPSVWQEQPAPVQHYPAPERIWGAFWPLSLLMASFLILMVTQLIGNSKTRTALETSRTERAKTVVEADKVSTSLESLVRDLLDLARNNDHARTVIEKYQIKQSEPVK